MQHSAPSNSSSELVKQSEAPISVFFMEAQQWVEEAMADVVCHPGQRYQHQKANTKEYHTGCPHDLSFNILVIHKRDTFISDRAQQQT